MKSVFFISFALAVYAQEKGQHLVVDCGTPNYYRIFSLIKKRIFERNNFYSL